MIDEIHFPPEWMLLYLQNLADAVGYDGKLTLGVVERAKWPKRAGVTDEPHGITLLCDDGSDVIVLPDDAVEDDNWRSVICHEFVHVLHSRVDRFALPFLKAEDRKAYMTEVEGFIEPFTVLLMMAAMLNAKFTRGGSGISITVVPRGSESQDARS